MVNTYSKDSEFGIPPREDPILKERDILPREEFAPPAEMLPVSEYPAPAPEVVAPGEYPWSLEAKERKQQYMKMVMFVLSAALAVMAAFGLLKGTPLENVEIVSGPGNTVTPVITEPEPEPEPEPVPVVDEYVAPVCDLVAFSFSSEIRGKATFRDMENAETVTYEVWDPLTGEMELQEDITEQAMTGTFDIGPFYTDFIFERHEEEYREANSFPMEVEIRIIIDHKEGQDTYSAITKGETGFYAMYEPKDSPWAEWADYPGCMIIKLFDSPEDFEIVFDEPEKVGHGVMSISCEIDGVKVDPSQFKLVVEHFEGTFSDGHTEDVIHRTIVLQAPPDIQEGGDSVAHFTITHYLENYGRVFVSEEDVPFESGY